MKYDKCPVCGSSKLKPFIKVNGYRVSEKQFVIEECENCSFKLTNPLPSEDEIGKYYESDNYISHTSSSKSLFDAAYQMVRRRAIKSKLNLVSKYVKKGVLVDYGCGTGSFLSFVKDQGWSVSGFEPSDIAISNGETNLKDEVKHPRELDNVKEHSIDVFTMWHVFEHIYNPKDLLNKIKRILNKNGVLILAVPNPDSLDAKIYKENWAAWDVPIHHSHFNKKSMKILLENNGFKLVEVKEMPFDSFYISALSEELAKGSKNYIRAFKNGLKSNIKGYREKNTSSLIYIAQPL